MSGRRRVLYIDAGCGASGDMILGALIDVGVPQAVLKRALAGLPLDAWKLSAPRIERAGLRLRQARVRVGPADDRRRFRDVRGILRRGGLTTSVRERALAVFSRLFEAEAEVHGTDVERIHLHEAGATDAIVDVVGACVGLDWLELDRIDCSPITTGFGRVRCAHGSFPVPAPATALLARGLPTRGGEREVERLTPTGAAILATCVDRFGPPPLMEAERLGYGAGSRDLGDDPNALRMTVGRLVEDEVSAVVVVETDIDDAAPENLAHAAEKLLALGALDVTTTPTTMKKGRVGHRLTVLTRRARLDAVARTLFEETGTLGLRYHAVERIELPRRRRTVRTPWGPVRIKVGGIEGEPSHLKPEYEDCRVLALEHGVPLEQVQSTALELYRRRKR